jgi:hypothetical protein
MKKEFKEYKEYKEYKEFQEQETGARSQGGMVRRHD